MGSAKKSSEESLSSILDRWIERFLWTQPAIEEKFNASKRGLEDKKTAFRWYYHRLITCSYDEWVSEFLFRNERFQADILNSTKGEAVASLPHPFPAWVDYIRQEYRVYVLRCTPPRTVLNEKLVCVKVAKAPRVNALRAFPTNEKHPLGEIKSIFIIRSNKPKKYECHYWGTGFQSQREILASFLESQVIRGDHVLRGNRLLLSVDLSAPATTVRQEIKETLDAVLGKAQVKKPPIKRWAQHLMIYDLRTIRARLTPLSELLYAIYGEKAPVITKDKICATADTIRPLIYGGYIKYF